MIQPVKDTAWVPAVVSWDVLRLDHLHPVVSGNKWFKLQPWIRKALAEGYQGLASFGGPWSNHLHALAWAAREAGLRSVGYIRGYPPPQGNPMLDDLRAWGMDVRFLPRKTFDAHAWTAPGTALVLPGPLGDPAETGKYLLVPAGGYGAEGMRGAARIWDHIPKGQYTHIYCAVGSGTMMAGLMTGNPEASATITGIPVVQDSGKLESAIRALLPPGMAARPIPLDHRHHGGGYAKTSPELLAFMQDFHDRTAIPTDIIYTAKLMYALRQMMTDGYFPAGSRVLAIHSGGLQGNRSLPPGTLHW